MNEIAEVHVEINEDYNPCLRSPNTPFEQPFYQTKDTLSDIDFYKRFIENCIARFRHSRTYKNYKYYLYSIGLDHCQLLGNIDAGEKGDKRSIEMHHNFLNIFDITLLITEHLLNTKGMVSSFDVVQLLKEEHKANNIPIVMLSKTVHQLYHNSSEGVVIPARMCFGYWYELLKKYSKGLTVEIMGKVVLFIKRSIEYEQSIGCNPNQNLLALRDEMMDWSEYNEYGDHMQFNGVVY